MVVTYIQGRSGWSRISLKEIWNYRELLFFLSWRDIKVRYKQTALGVAWAILQPLLTMAIFSIFFGRLAKVPSDGVPYPVFALTALAPWTFFANALAQSSNSVITNSSLVTKVFFPRLIIPMSAALAGIVDLVIALMLLVGALVVYRVPLTAGILLLPLVAVMAIAVALGAGFWLSALNVRYRDVRYALPFLVQIWMFLSPVAYSSSLVPGPWRTLYGLNPMSGVIEGFRHLLLGTQAVAPQHFVLSAVVAMALLISGAAYFCRTEKSFSDVI